MSLEKSTVSCNRATLNKREIHFEFAFKIALHGGRASSLQADPSEVLECVLPEFSLCMPLQIWGSFAGLCKYAILGKVSHRIIP